MIEKYQIIIYTFVPKIQRGQKNNRSNSFCLLG